MTTEETDHDSEPSMTYQLLTTTRYDPFLSTISWNQDSGSHSPFFLLPYHYERLIHAAERHGWAIAADGLDYETFKIAINAALSEKTTGDGNTTAFRIRILLSKGGELIVSAVSLEHPFVNDPFALSLSEPNPHPESDSLLKVYVDRQPTPASIFTSTKTTLRTVYDKARERNGIPPLTTAAGRTADVVLYNADGMITETSIFNVAFYRASAWVTPAATTGCLPGVARRWLLEQNRVLEDKEGSLKLENIMDGEVVLLFNGVQGCRWGKIISERSSV